MLSLHDTPVAWGTNEKGNKEKHFHFHFLNFSSLLTMRRSCSSSAALQRLAVPVPSTLGFGMARPLHMAPAECLISRSPWLHNSRHCLVGTAARRSYSSAAPPPSSPPPQDNKPQSDTNSEAPSSSTAEEAKDQSRPASDTPTEPGTQPPPEQPPQQSEPINLFTAGTALIYIILLLI